MRQSFCVYELSPKCEKFFENSLKMTYLTLRYMCIIFMQLQFRPVSRSYRCFCWCFKSQIFLQSTVLKFNQKPMLEIKLVATNLPLLADELMAVSTNNLKQRSPTSLSNATYIFNKCIKIFLCFSFPQIPVQRTASPHT